MGGMISGIPTSAPPAGRWVRPDDVRAISTFPVKYQATTVVRFDFNVARTKVYWARALFPIVLYLLLCRYLCITQHLSATSIAQRVTYGTGTASHPEPRMRLNGADRMTSRSTKYRTRFASGRANLTFEHLEPRHLFSVSSPMPPLEQMDTPPPLTSNYAPIVYAGADMTVSIADGAVINGEVIANIPSNLSITWSLVSGPGSANFLGTNSPSTTVAFSQAGTYELELTAENGGVLVGDRVVVNVESSNEEEVLATNNPIVVTEGGTGTITAALLETTDADNTPAELVYTITSGTSSGLVLLSGIATSTFTQADINAGLVTYEHDDNGTTSDSFSFVVDDTEGTTTNGVFTVVITDIPENLIEMFARKDRRGTAIWGAQYLEDPNTFQWQPETFMYYDVATGHEVWKLSSTPQLSTYYFEDIGLSPWNADGSKVSFTAFDRYTQAYNQSQQETFPYIWMTADTNGENMRPTVEASRRLGRGFFHWSPQEPNTWYEIGTAHLSSTGQNNVLYRSTVDDDGVVDSQAVLALPSEASNSTINKLISSDGRRLVLEGGDRFWPITILPDGTAQLDDPDGYSIDRNFGPYGGMNGGTVTGFHDQYIGGTGDSFFVMPNDPAGTATWWKISTVGSAADGGAIYTGNDGQNNFGEVSPESYANVLAGNLESPFVQLTQYSPDKTSYWSHFVPDRWGTNALFSNVSSDLPGGTYAETIGPGVWNIENHEWVVASFGGGSQHHDWSGFTDWTVSSGGPWDEATGYGATLLLAGNINDPNSQIVINDTHTRYDGGTAYSSLARPGQSPDGTKVSWHSEFLNGKDAVDIYWSVVYQPYPATDLEGATAAGGGVELGFLPPKYTDRGWINPATGEIDEVNGETLYAREIEQYQFWRSNSPTGGWQTVGSVEAEYANDPVTNTLKPVAGGNWVSANNKITFQDTANDGVWYYAVTSREHSGLESDELSEVVEVTVSGGNVASSQIVQAQGQKDFWTEAPTAPSSLTVVQQSEAGHYQLNWTEPNGSMVRYYNVYYSTTGQPSANQSQRIASLAVGTNAYLDWLADPNASGIYGITAVDWYGNESAVIYEGVSGLNAASVGDSSDATYDLTAVPAAVVDAAIRYWANTGLSQQEIGLLRAAEVHLADLSGLQVGAASSAGIILDYNAAGHGWFVDATPDEHSEFDLNSDGSYLASEGSAAEGRLDLLTVITHEMGHLLGLDDIDSKQDSDIMTGILQTGQRHVR